jgi:hypothetical protein
MAQQTLGDGSVIKIIQETSATQSLVNCGGNNPIQKIWDPPTITPNIVGSFGTFVFSFELTSPLAVGDNFKFTLPVLTQAPVQPMKFELIDDGQIQAVVNNIALKTFVYEDLNELWFEVITPVPVFSCQWPHPIDILDTYCANYIFKITQLRNAAWAFTSTYTIRLMVIRNQAWLHNYVFNSVSPPSVGEFVSSSQTLSKYAQGDVFVEYNYQATPSYHIPPGSKLDLDFPNSGMLSFSHLASSNPAARCEVTPA